MDIHMKRCLAAMRKADPLTHRKPSTEADWLRLQKARIEVAYHSFRSVGYNKSEAKKFAQLINGGQLGRKLLELAFESPDGEEAAK